MTPHLYDLLDVDETASADEIRAAWKAAIADLEPTDRRFRVYNDAAAVLLDADRRAEYDAGLAAERAAAAAAEEAAQPEPAAASEAEPVAEPAAGEPQDRAPDRDDTPPSSAGRPGPATGTLVAVGVAAALALALLVWVLTLPGTTADLTPAERSEQAARLDDAASAAEDAAAQIVPVALTYDYRTFDEDVAAAQAVMTDDFGAERSALLADLREQAVDQRSVVTAAIAGTGVTRVSDGGDLATVVVFVDQNVEKAGSEPTVLRMWVTATLVRDGDEWLLDGMCVEAGCGD